MNIGIDIGTSWIKVYSADAEKTENAQFAFPSVYASRWGEDGKTLTEAIGTDALKLNIKKNTKLVWPVIKGSIKGSEAEAKILIKAAIQKVAGDTKIKMSDINVGVGLPLKAQGDSKMMFEMLKSMGVGKVGVWNQTQGTLSDLNIETGIVISLGHGTTEIMAYHEYEQIDGVSLIKASDRILEQLGGNKFLKHDYIAQHAAEIKPAVEDFIAEVVNNVRKLKDGIQDDEIEEMPIIITGGGVNIPGVQEQLKAKMPYKYQIAKDAIFSIARGLYKNIAMQDVQQTEDVVTVPQITTS